jgi:hypothetical protein
MSKGVSCLVLPWKGLDFSLDFSLKWVQYIRSQKWFTFDQNTLWQHVCKIPHPVRVHSRKNESLCTAQQKGISCALLYCTLQRTKISEGTMKKTQFLVYCTTNSDFMCSPVHYTYYKLQSAASEPWRNHVFVCTGQNEGGKILLILALDAKAGGTEAWYKSS